MKNHVVRSFAHTAQFEPLSMRRAKRLLHIGSNTFDIQVFSPEIEDDEHLSQFAYVIL
jgi:hypothetical protein